MVERLGSKYEAPSSNSSIKNKNKTKQKSQQEKESATCLEWRSFKKF
jgi:hypothetical protein